MDPDDTGRTIREIRSASGISLRVLARRLGVSPATLSAIETGRTKISVDRLQAVAAELNTTAGELLFGFAGPAPPAAAASAETTRPRPILDQPTATNWRHFPPLEIDPVLTAGIAAFVRTGYHGATMRSLAQRAGMSVPGVYHYYSSKQALLVATLDLTMADLLWRVGAAHDEATEPAERVALIVEALALFHTHRRELAFIGASEMRSLDPPNRERIAGLRNSVQRRLDDAIADGIRDGTLTTTSPRHGARAISTMCTSLPQWFRADGPATPEQVATEYAQFALGLLGHRPDPAE